MAYVTNNNIKINYKVEGEGKYLVLYHGLYGSLEDWYEYGYVDALKKRFKLILIDGRGHGESDKPYAYEEYSLYLRAMDVIKVLEKENIVQCSYMGYSMGGWIGLGLMKWFPSKINSLVLNSIHPFENDMISIGQVLNTLDKWVPESNFSEQRKERILKNDIEALRASVKEKREDNSDVLTNISIPCLMMAGEEDGIFELVKKGSMLSNRIQFASIPEADHLKALTMSEQVLLQVEKFLDYNNR